MSRPRTQEQPASAAAIVTPPGQPSDAEIVELALRIAQEDAELMRRLA